MNLKYNDNNCSSHNMLFGEYDQIKNNTDLLNKVLSMLKKYKEEALEQENYMQYKIMNYLFKYIHCNMKFDDEKCDKLDELRERYKILEEKYFSLKSKCNEKDFSNKKRYIVPFERYKKLKEKCKFLIDKNKENDSCKSDELLKMKEFHYGNIHDCPMSQLLIAARMLDKVRRLVRLSYLEEVEKDLGHIPAVEQMLSDSSKIEEDTLNDLKNYIHLYERGKCESSEDS